jgi:adenosylcobyric acid synthase
LLIDAEDSLSLSTYSKHNDNDKEIDIAVINYPRISNFTDIDPFLSERDTHVRLVENARQLEQPDVIILPGSKNTIEDLLFLREKGLEQEIIRAHQNGAVIFGICGGYQMLGEKIEDPFQVESKIEHIEGLKMLPLETLLTKAKTTIRSTGTMQLFGANVNVAGYEIHMGTTTHTSQVEPLIQLNDREDGSKNNMETCIGTYFHGIFHNDEFRGVVLNHIRKKKGLQPILKRESFEDSQKKDFDRLADHVRNALDIEFLYEIMDQYAHRKRD